MVLILDGSSEHDAHLWRKLGISICLRHLVTSIELSNPSFFSQKTPILLNTCATCSELPTYIRTVVQSKHSTMEALVKYKKSLEDNHIFA